MEDFDLLLADRLGAIRDFITKHGEENFYLSFSGGKDSTALSHMLDEALPNNRIPRVYLDTGIEYQAVKEFVQEQAKSDDRFIIIKPSKPIRQMLEKEGYPFKSKEHSCKLNMYQQGSTAKTLLKYKDESSKFSCPQCLKYQFQKDFRLKVSDHCCYELKKYPAKAYEKESGRHIAILGLRAGEQGQRRNHEGCIAYAKDGKTIAKFKPLNPTTEEFTLWYIKKRNITLCKLYYPPYNLKRTGCKGCPYAIDLQEELTMMDKYLPNERKQCEIIWKPVYDEYRRIGYRLTKEEQLKLF